MENELLAASLALRKAGPLPILSALHQAGAERISLDVPAHAQEMAVGMHRKSLESALINGSGARRAMDQIPTLSMVAAQPGHERRQVAIGGRSQHQVKVVWHQAVREAVDWNVFLSFSGQVEKMLVIASPVEDPHSSDTAVEHVKDKACGVRGLPARHGRRTSKSTAN